MSGLIDGLKRLPKAVPSLQLAPPDGAHVPSLPALDIRAPAVGHKVDAGIGSRRWLAPVHHSIFSFCSASFSAALQLSDSDLCRRRPAPKCADAWASRGSAGGSYTTDTAAQRNSVGFTRACPWPSGVVRWVPS